MEIHPHTRIKEMTYYSLQQIDTYIWPIKLLEKKWYYWDKLFFLQTLRKFTLYLVFLSY